MVAADHEGGGEGALAWLEPAPDSSAYVARWVLRARVGKEVVAGDFDGDGEVEVAAIGGPGDAHLILVDGAEGEVLPPKAYELEISSDSEVRLVEVPGPLPSRGLGAGARGRPEADGRAGAPGKHAGRGAPPGQCQETDVTAPPSDGEAL